MDRARSSPIADSPTPLERGEGVRILEALARGTPWREAFETLLLELPLIRAERVMQLVREGRGAFLCLFAAPSAPSPRALLIANALSGSAVALARAGYALTVLDCNAERLAVARARDGALCGGRSAFVCAGGAVLPLVTGVFDLVVQEGGEHPDGLLHPLQEVARVARGDVVLWGENRLAYKRSSGVRGDFRVPAPTAWLRQALQPSRSERTLAGYRRALVRVGLIRTDAYALYPHADDFSHVVALDAPLPRLSIGPKERENPLKVAAKRAGLFPLLTPSYALHARAPGAESFLRRSDTWLATVAAHVDEPLAHVEILISTRGNTAVLLTARHNAPEDDPRGRYALHVPLSPQQEVQARRHFAHLVALRRRFPTLPLPEPLFEGSIDGQYFTAERRLGGISAPQLTGDHGAASRTYRDVDKQLGALGVGRAVLDSAGFDRWFGAKFRRVAERAGHAPTVHAIERLARDLQIRLDGVEIPLVFQHADLRSKHIQVDESGSVVGYLDFGSAEDEDLPLFDLANLILHDLKQETGCSAAVAWRRLASGDLRSHERDALALHAERLALPAVYVQALHAAHPVLVAAMAEKNWDYSRPRWLWRNFDV